MFLFSSAVETNARFLEYLETNFGNASNLDLIGLMELWMTQDACAAPTIYFNNLNLDTSNLMYVIRDNLKVIKLIKCLEVDEEVTYLFLLFLYFIYIML